MTGSSFGLAMPPRGANFYWTMPTLLNGEPIEVITALAVEFRLEH